MPINGLRLPCLQVLLAQGYHFLLFARSDHTTGNRNIKPEVVFKVQKLARYASFCLKMDPFKQEVPVVARLWPLRVRVRVSFTTGTIRSAIVATAGLLVLIVIVLVIQNNDDVCVCVGAERLSSAEVDGCSNYLDMSVIQTSLSDAIIQRPDESTTPPADTHNTGALQPY